MTIKYHGTPITPRAVLYDLAGCHFCISYARPDDLAACQQIGQSVMIDNGAFTAWRKGRSVDWSSYARWCADRLGPADWCVMPDVIDGTDDQNDALVESWPLAKWRSAPVWHLHEPITRLERLAREWPRVCLGSSGEYAVIGTKRWEARMDEAFNRLCGGSGRPPCAVHGLRMMAQAGRRWPFASLDSTDVAQNHSRPHNGARRMAERWNALQCPARWETRPEQIVLMAGAESDPGNIKALKASLAG